MTKHKTVLIAWVLFALAGGVICATTLVSPGAQAEPAEKKCCP